MLPLQKTSSVILIMHGSPALSVAGMCLYHRSPGKRSWSKSVSMMFSRFILHRSTGYPRLYRAVMSSILRLSSEAPSDVCWMALMNFDKPRIALASDLAPVHTTFPVLKSKMQHLGFRIRTVAVANTDGRQVAESFATSAGMLSFWPPSHAVMLHIAIVMSQLGGIAYSPVGASTCSPIRPTGSLRDASRTSGICRPVIGVHSACKNKCAMGSAMLLRRDESISLQYNAARNIINQFKTVGIIVISLAIQDVARSFYTSGEQEPIDMGNFFIMSGLALISLLLITILEAFIRSWERAAIERLKSLRADWAT
jgi:hypothetical protein